MPSRDADGTAESGSGACAEHAGRGDCVVSFHVRGVQIVHHQHRTSKLYDASLYTHRSCEARMLFKLIFITIQLINHLSIHTLFATANAGDLTTKMPTSLRYGEQIIEWYLCQGFTLVAMDASSFVCRFTCFWLMHA